VPHRVIKLGGSLLDFEGLVPRLRDWLAAQPPMPNVMVVGGGRLADVIRDAFARHALGEEAAHWLCIRLLGVSAELAARLLSEAVLVKRYEELLDEGVVAELKIFEPEQYLRDESRVLAGAHAMGITPLPHSWNVTSDSIAARLAVVLRAGELVLLKSALPSGAATLQQAADAGYVDRYFHTAASELRQVRCVNLRSDDFAETRLPG